MSIQTVADNLRNTIAGKENMLLFVQQERTFVGLRDGEDIELRTTAELLELNIGELKRILQDVEQCVAKDVEQSWRDNPDRMGGQFTQDELNESGWK
jgi:hypothetical protein